MTVSTFRLPLLAALLVGLGAAAVGRAQNMQVTAAGIALGAQVTGPRIGPDDLVGRVVMLEFWGIHCGPCIASMPHLEELHRTFGPQGLLLVGAHAQGGTADEIRRTVAELGITFTIVDGATVDGGMDFGGIPHCMVFDHTGACVYRGSPRGADDAVAAAVKASPAAILAGRTLVKLAAVGQMLRNEALCGAALRKTRALLDSPDRDTADEARFVVERIEARGRDMLERARELAGEDPVAATALAHRCSGAFRGTDIGADAAGLLGEWRSDKDFQAALKGRQQLARLEALEVAAARFPGPVPPQVMSQAREIARQLEKDRPSSDEAAKAAGIVARLGEQGPAARK